MSTQKILSEVAGSIWKIETAAGQRIAAVNRSSSSNLMKMEIPVEAPVDGVITILVDEGRRCRRASAGNHRTGGWQGVMTANAKATAMPVGETGWRSGKAGGLDWHDELTELQQRRQWADGLGGAEAVARHHDNGRLTVRERIAALTDADSFQEVGKLAGQGHIRMAASAHVTPAPYVMGLASIGGRPVAIGGEDYTIRGGCWSGDKGGQGDWIERRSNTGFRWST